MKILMPMAGLGSRFTKVGIATPKPLIEVLGKPMVKWAMGSLPFARPEDMIFVVRTEHIENYQIDEKLRQIFSPRITILDINYTTEGAACTALLAKKHINNDEPLIITDCDHFFTSKKYNQIAPHPGDIDGIIPVAHRDEDKFSFTKVDSSWRASEVAEKVRISPYANIGAYHFSKGRFFVDAAEEMIGKNMRIKNEFYIAPVYNMLIQQGKHIIAALCEEAHWIGTPEDVQAFLKVGNKFVNQIK